MLLKASMTSKLASESAMAPRGRDEPTLNQHSVSLPSLPGPQVCRGDLPSRTMSMLRSNNTADKDTNFCKRSERPSAACSKTCLNSSISVGNSHPLAMAGTCMSISEVISRRRSEASMSISHPVDSNLPATIRKSSLNSSMDLSAH